MKTITLNLPGNGYDILIGEGLLAGIGQKLNGLGFREKAVVVTNPVVRNLYGGTIGSSLAGSDFSVSFIEIPDGEQYKTLETTGNLYQELNDCHAERSTPLLALGGGVIGDLTGFVAATFKRGLPFIQLPTTLLAQVDAGIGGKTAVDHGRLKNMVGVFYQPRVVVADVGVLKTLSDRDLSNGLAEVIKCGVIKDSKLFSYVEENMAHLKERQTAALEEIVYRSAAIKVRLVEDDEKDVGPRHLLNFGHTVGHGIESASDFKLNHGEAVALGMLAAARISLKLGYFSIKELARLEALLKHAGLPTRPGNLDMNDILQAMSHDKKITRGRLKFILAKSIGEAFISQDVSLAQIETVLKDWNAT